MSNNLAAARQVSRYYIARAQRSRQFISQATPWSSGLTITESDIVSNNGLAWEAQNSGVTSGGSGPDNSGGALSVGIDGIEWLHILLLLVAPDPVT